MFLFLFSMTCSSFLRNYPFCFTIFAEKSKITAGSVNIIPNSSYSKQAEEYNYFRSGWLKIQCMTASREFFERTGNYFKAGSFRTGFSQSDSIRVAFVGSSKASSVAQPGSPSENEPAWLAFQLESPPAAFSVGANIALQSGAALSALYSTLIVGWARFFHEYFCSEHLASYCWANFVVFSLYFYNNM